MSLHKAIHGWYFGSAPRSSCVRNDRPGKSCVRSTSTLTEIFIVRLVQ